MSVRGLAIWLTLFLSSHAFSARVESLVVKQEGNHSVALFTLAGECTPKVFALTHPDRVVVDFNQTHAVRSFNHMPLPRGFIDHVRTGRPTPNTLRLVFDVAGPSTIKTSRLKPLQAHQCRLQIEFFSKRNLRNLKDTKKEVAVKKSMTHVKNLPSRRLRDVVVVIDPGHGGKDPGASGPRRSVEKNIVLAIAVKLKRLIDKEPGMRAVLTRHGDYYVGLRERLNIARRANADVFVSIHADAFINHHSFGASVFSLSQTGATSEAARWLAEKENNSELGGVNLSGLDDRSGLIRTVLLDLSQTATISSSLQMGKRVLRYLDRVTSLHNSRVEQARFVVLKSPDIPSILIETGFISNPREEKNLTNNDYQGQLSLAILHGLQHYFHDYPPHGTRLESMGNAFLHIVKNGARKKSTVTPSWA